MDAYRNASLSADDRTADLMARMTLEEKAAQLSGIWVYEILSGTDFDGEKAASRMGSGIGQITRLGGASNFVPAIAAARANEIQRFLVERTRLGVPALIHEESCSGYLTRGADVFPQTIGIASSFDDGIASEMGRIIREQMRALGARQALAPLLDITRDPRWGRTEETFGEDRFLTSRMGVAYIKGLQGDSLGEGILATGKHFVGYGMTEGAMNWSPAHIPEREMRETYLYPFEAAVREGNLRSIMPGYHELDGIPCHTNEWLLDTVLRKEWGFEGLVVSDYFAINMIHDYHKTTEGKHFAARMALKAGVDVELPSTDVYGAPLVEAVKSGIVPIALVDACVRRILSLKFNLGLFDRPYVDEKAAPAHFQTAGQRAFSRKAAEKSIVLLKNDGVLPLARAKRRIAVIGPNADSIRNMLGDYSYPAHVESLIDMASDNFANTALPSGMPKIEDAMPDMDSILAGLRKAAPEAEFTYAKGCDVIGGGTEGFAEAVRLSLEADLVVAVMGDKAGLIDGCTSGEAHDRLSIDLPGHQRELLEAVAKTGKKIVLVLVTGRPTALVREAELCSAIVEAWFPGEEGAAAVARVLFGDVNPAGRLPISFPRTVGQVPVYYSHKPSGGQAHWKGNYADGPTTPLFPFGYGLSYTNFEYSSLSVPERCDVAGSFTVSVSVKNTGSRDGEEVAQLYLRDMVSDVTRPVAELFGFARVSLRAGETKRISFTVHTDQLAFLDREMRLVVEPGEIKAMVGASSADIRLAGSVNLVGERRAVAARKFATETRVE
ncbi:MAG TPA: glycoside hydrolase family 3 N-terminal domain-containing protein [Treponemataceae bacterium]|nr:glycoside hydrolase family 3 N-terminal domain-containing protein [Treponemataceae bacterium]